MKQKVALFDFDNTIASGDTIHRLLTYDIKKHPIHILYLLKLVIFYVLYLLHIVSFEQVKSTLLFPLDHMTDEQLKQFYKNHVEIYYYPHMVEEIKKKKEEGYIVIVCTASSEVYMQYNELPIDCLLGTKTKRIDNHPSSQIIGKNCKGKEKIPRILEYLQSQNIEIDYENSYGYSDSNSDIPMLSLVKNRKRILLKTGEMIDFK